MHKVKFKRGLQASYDALGEKDADTVYVCTDTGNSYLGGERLNGDWRELLGKPDLVDYTVEAIPGHTSYSGLRLNRRQY